VSRATTQLKAECSRLCGQECDVTIMRVPPAADRSIAPRMRPSWAVCVSLTQSTMRCGPCAWPRGLSLRLRHHVRICTWMRQRTASHAVCTPTSNRRLTASGCAWCFVSCLLMLHFPRSCRATRDTALMVPGLAALRYGARLTISSMPSA